MGKKSFALVKEILRKQNGRYPIRDELFEECYYKADGSSTSEAIKEAIEQMKELDSQDSQNSNSNRTIHNPDDSFAKIMDKVKDGQLRMYGLGVTIVDVYGEKPSRATLLRQAMEYKEKFLEAVKKYETLNAKLEDLSAYVHRTQFGGQPDAQSTPSSSPSREVGSQNALPTTPNGQAGTAYVPIASPNGQVNTQSPLLSCPHNLRLFGSAAMRIKLTIIELRNLWCIIS